MPAKTKQPVAAPKARSGFYMLPAEVTERFIISRRTLDEWVDQGIVPEPHRFTDKTVRYVRAEIEAVRPLGVSA